MIAIIFGIFVAIFALIFLVVGVVALVGTALQQRRCCASVDGIVSTVYAEKQKHGKQETTVYIPEFRYEAGGQIHTMKASFGSMKRQFQEGQAVVIRYDPKDPKSAYVADDPNNSSQGGVMCICLGLLLTLGALALFA